VLVLAALADPVRREIGELLADGERGAGESAERFPVTRGRRRSTSPNGDAHDDRTAG
jgi:DNA-binding transcriptional ArsR family regulator